MTAMWGGMLYILLSLVGAKWIFWCLCAAWVWQVARSRTHLTGSMERRWAREVRAPAPFAVPMPPQRTPHGTFHRTNALLACPLRLISQWRGWRHIASYFPIEVRAEAKLQGKDRHVFAVHPHSIHCWALGVFAGTTSPVYDAYPGLSAKGLVATVMFRLPVVRELFLVLGYRDARRSSADRILREGHSLFLCTGGESESLETEPGREAVCLDGRYGFVRLALKHGAHLVPVYAFGQNDLYHTTRVLAGVRKWIQKRLHLALPIFWGRGFTPMPLRRPITIVVGHPVRVPPPDASWERGEPPRELVVEYHKRCVPGRHPLCPKRAHCAAARCQVRGRAPGHVRPAQGLHPGDGVAEAGGPGPVTDVARSQGSCRDALYKCRAHPQRARPQCRPPPTLCRLYAVCHAIHCSWAGSWG